VGVTEGAPDPRGATEGAAGGVPPPLPLEEPVQIGDAVEDADAHGEREPPLAVALSNTDARTEAVGKDDAVDGGVGGEDPVAEADRVERPLAAAVPVPRDAVGDALSCEERVTDALPVGGPVAVGEREGAGEAVPVGDAAPLPVSAAVPEAPPLASPLREGAELCVLDTVALDDAVEASDARAVPEETGVLVGVGVARAEAMARADGASAAVAKGGGVEAADAEGEGVAAAEVLRLLLLEGDGEFECVGNAEREGTGGALPPAVGVGGTLPVAVGEGMAEGVADEDCAGQRDARGVGVATDTEGLPEGERVERGPTLRKEEGLSTGEGEGDWVGAPVGVLAPPDGVPPKPGEGEPLAPRDNDPCNPEGVVGAVALSLGEERGERAGKALPAGERELAALPELLAVSPSDSVAPAVAEKAGEGKGGEDADAAARGEPVAAAGDGVTAPDSVPACVPDAAPEGVGADDALPLRESPPLKVAEGEARADGVLPTLPLPPAAVCDAVTVGAPLSVESGEADTEGEPLSDGFTVCDKAELPVAAPLPEPVPDDDPETVGACEGGVPLPEEEEVGDTVGGALLPVAREGEGEPLSTPRVAVAPEAVPTDAERVATTAGDGENWGERVA
jgi:hypothetical protein